MIFKRRNKYCWTYFRPSLLARWEIFLIRRIYQPFLSPIVGRQCRFFPTCSHYALDSLQKYSLWQANLRIVFRILRCNPFCKGGYDPA